MVGSNLHMCYVFIYAFLLLDQQKINVYFLSCLLPFKLVLLSSVTGSARGVPVAIPADQTEVSPPRLCFDTAWFRNYCHYCSVAVTERIVPTCDILRNKTQGISH